MKEIKIFLASSINEFRVERNAIGDFIRRLQDKFIEYDIYFDLFECEFHDNTIASEERMQLVYNEIAMKSDLFFMLIGKRAGEFTVEEYMEVRNVSALEKYVIFYGNDQDETVLSLKTIVNQDTLTNVVTTNDLKEILEVFKGAIEKELNNEYRIIVDEQKIRIESSL